MATLFLPTDVPASFSSNATNVNVGMAFFVSVAAFAVGIRFYKNPSDPASSRTVTLWDVATQASLGSAVSSGESASGWQQVAISPVALTANKAYKVSVRHPSPTGYYCYDSNYFTANKVNGIITGYKDKTVPPSNTPNCTYDFNSTADYPTNDSTVLANYWVDVVVSLAAGSPAVQMLVTN